MGWIEEATGSGGGSVSADQDFDSLLLDQANQDVGLVREASAALRVTNGSTGGGALNVGTTTDATASGDFAAGTSGDARVFYDQSDSSLNFYRTGTGFQYLKLFHTSNQVRFDTQGNTFSIWGPTGEEFRVTNNAVVSPRNHDLGGTSFPWGSLTLGDGSTNAQIYAEDNGSGKTRLMVQFPTGSPVQIAIEP